MVVEESYIYRLREQELEIEREAERGRKGKRKRDIHTERQKEGERERRGRGEQTDHTVNHSILFRATQMSDMRRRKDYTVKQPLNNTY